AQPSYWERLHELAMPVLLLAGSADVKFTALARAMRDGIADVTLRIIDGAGHATHLEEPDAFSEAVAGFLTQSFIAAEAEGRSGRDGHATTDNSFN
ncbi:MAG: hypothetical protein ABI629_17980, partial [bacterium]